MSPKHRYSLLLLLVLALAPIASGCASSGGGDTAPATPAKAPFTPPAFESTAYRNTELGFSVHYPVDFTVQDSPGALLSVASPQQVPRVDVNAIPSVGDATLETVGQGVAAGFTQIGGSEATLVESKEVILQDGVTRAMEFIVDWAFQGFPIRTLALVAPAGDQAVQVSVTWADALGDRETSNVDAIAYSLYFD